VYQEVDVDDDHDDDDEAVCVDRGGHLWSQARGQSRQNRCRPALGESDSNKRPSGARSRGAHSQD